MPDMFGALAQNPVLSYLGMSPGLNAAGQSIAAATPAPKQAPTFSMAPSTPAPQQAPGGMAGQNSAALQDLQKGNEQFSKAFKGSGGGPMPPGMAGPGAMGPASAMGAAAGGGIPW